MNRPAYQHYPGDWRRNAKLRRCSWAARGAWVDILGLMHDSDEYGILRWPLKEIAHSIGCPLPLCKELAAKQVMKGGDKRFEAGYVYAPMHAGKRGPEVILVPVQDGPIWFSSRMVRDEYNRNARGFGTRFGAAPNTPPIPPNGEPPKPPNGDGASTASAYPSLRSGENPPARKRARSPETPMPDGFAISDRVKQWAAERGIGQLAERFEHFVGKARAKGYRYADWDEGFMGAIRDDWAGLNGKGRDRREQQASNIDILTGKANGRIERTVIAERVDHPTLLAIPGGIREPDADDVEGRGPERSAGGVGR